MNKNFIFREFECGLSIEEAAELCLKTVRTVKSWDGGKKIPPECKRLMKMNKNRELSASKDWSQFRMCNDRLKLPTGKLVSPQQVLIGVALLELGAESDRKTAIKILRYARALSKMALMTDK
ncbi:regulator [Vibrio harveyi]|uniref:regulator n=1 Tax=Vibrio harveyi TaxID=669 RepID=UPI0027EC7555|nr:phage protein [Vibrio harveyi]